MDGTQQLYADGLVYLNFLGVVIKPEKRVPNVLSASRDSCEGISAGGDFGLGKTAITGLCLAPSEEQAGSGPLE